MECDALCDAPETVIRYRLVVLCEAIKADQQRLTDFFAEQSYRRYAIGINYLLIPEESDWADAFVAPFLSP